MILATCRSRVAAGELAGLEFDRGKAVAGLLKVLREDKHEYVRRRVAGALRREGRAARATLPELRKFVDDPDVNVKAAFRQAVARIEKAKEKPGPGSGPSGSPPSGKTSPPSSKLAANGDH